MKKLLARAHAAKLHPFALVQGQGIWSPCGLSFLQLGSLCRALMVLAAIAISPSAWALDYTWAGTSNAWTSNASWSTVTSGPQLSSSSNNTDVAIFSNTGSSSFNAPNLTSNRTVNMLQFTSTAIAYTFNGSASRYLDVIGNGNSTVTSTAGIFNNSTATQTFTLGVQNSNGNGLVTSIAGGALVFNGGYNLTSSGSGTSRTVVFGGAGNITVASTIANGGSATAGAVTVTSTGNTIFSGNNTYGGLTTMNAANGTLTLSGNNSGAGGGVTLTAGTLNINHANALGSGALTLTAGTINNTSGAAVTNAGTQAWALNDLTFGTASSSGTSNLNLGTGVVTATTSRTITFAGSNTTLTMGRLDNTSTSSGRTITANGANNTLEIGGMNLSNNSTGAQTLKLAGSANFNITGAVTNGTAFDHGLSTTGTGIVTLSGNNTFTGLTTISAGSTLKLAHAKALGSTNNGTSVSGVLDLYGQTIGSEAIVLNGTGISSLGALVNTSGSNASLSGGVSLAANSSIGAGNITLSGNITESSAGKTLTKVGTGTLVLSGAANYTGGTTVSDGTLAITSGNSMNGLFSLSGANGPTLKLTDVNALGSATVVSGASSDANAGTIDLATAGNYTLGSYGNSTSAGANLKFTASSGSATNLTFSNNSAMTSSTGSSGSRTFTNSNSTLNILFSQTLDIGSTVGGNLTFAGSGNTTIQGAVYNNGAGARNLLKTGAGTLTLNGDNNYNGFSSFDSGTVLLNGNNTASTGNVFITSSATLGGTGIVGGNVTMSGTSKIGTANSTLTLAKNLNITGTNELAATSNVSVSSNTTVSSGSFTVNGTLSGTGAVAVSSGAILGGSGSIAGSVNVTGSLAPGNSIESLGTGSLTFLSNSTYSYELNSTNLAGDLAFSSAGLSIADGLVVLSLTDLTPGTLTNDNKLTLISYKNSWDGGRFKFSGATVDDDSTITLGANQWKLNYNDTSGGSNFTTDQSGASSFVTMTVVPEPSTAILSGLGLLLLVRRRR